MYQITERNIIKGLLLLGMLALIIILIQQRQTNRNDMLQEKKLVHNYICLFIFKNK